MLPSVERFRGCLLGLAVGDAHGAPFEGGAIERLVWRVIGRTRDGRRRFTDDTQMALDLAAVLIERGVIDQQHLARRFAQSYRWSRGYGKSAAKVLRRIRGGMAWQQANRSVHASGSFGNGAAMRAPVIGMFFAARPSELALAVRQSGEITHAHELALEGASIIAHVTAQAMREAAPRTMLDMPRAMLDAATAAAHSAPFVDRLTCARRWIDSGAEPSPQQVREQLGTRITATESVVTAVYLAARFAAQPFERLLAFVAACGGDVDTISAMAGAIWGAHRGAAALPLALVNDTERAEEITATATALHAASSAGVRI